MRTRTIGLIVFAVCLVATVAAVGLSMGRAPSESSSSGSILGGVGGDYVALIKLDGTITDSIVAPYRSGRDSENFYAQLVRAEKDNNARAVVVRVNSPGGSAVASQEIYDEIMRIRAKDKRVVIYLTDVAASGGYYVASAGNRIVAQPATLTGSIGVIITSLDLRGLYEKVGVQERVIKSGPYKDILSATRDLTPEERAILEKLIQDTLNQFVKVVAEGRNMPEADVRRIADGRVFSGTEALNLKLVDELGDQHRAIALAAELAGMKGEPRVVLYEQPRSTGILSLLGSQEALPGSEALEEVERLLPNSGISVRYEWR